jgi:hypothetical protein
MLEDFDSSTNNPDFPTEWLSCIHKALMAEVAGTYGKSEKMILRLQQNAQIALLEMKLWDSGDGSTFVVPAYRDDD